MTQSCLRMQLHLINSLELVLSSQSYLLNGKSRNPKNLQELLGVASFHKTSFLDFTTNCKATILSHVFFWINLFNQQGGVRPRNSCPMASWTTRTPCSRAPSTTPAMKGEEPLRCSSSFRTHLLLWAIQPVLWLCLHLHSSHANCCSSSTDVLLSLLCQDFPHLL